MEKDDLFLTQQEWDNFLDYIANGYDLEGSPHNGYGSGVYTYNNKSIKAKDNTFMTANMYNGAISKMRWVSEEERAPGEYEKSGGFDGDIIKAKYFRDLEDYYNKNFKSKYCDDCNSCEACDSCNDCESGQCTESPYCCSCDTCESDNASEDDGGK